MGVRSADLYWLLYVWWLREQGLTNDEGAPYPSNPHQTGYKKLRFPIWPLVDDPHEIGSAHVPWLRDRSKTVAEEEDVVEAMAARL